MAIYAYNNNAIILFVCTFSWSAFWRLRQNFVFWSKPWHFHISPFDLFSSKLVACGLIKDWQNVRKSFKLRPKRSKPSLHLTKARIDQKLWWVWTITGRILDMRVCLVKAWLRSDEQLIFLSGEKAKLFRVCDVTFCGQIFVTKI